ncbi:uncharacterized protein LOC131285858 [Anopheles ziemanni]|uniref:uncharacterized protein LOC131285858 n=1 Tax=Anopheles ziemanni TaxID=345580 RepID=UPI00265F2A61|nr:uncharacterized protein LOC131285858 [Anopheles ziemanni]
MGRHSDIDADLLLIPASVMVRPIMVLCLSAVKQPKPSFCLSGDSKNGGRKTTPCQTRSSTSQKLVCQHTAVRKDGTFGNAACHECQMDAGGSFSEDAFLRCQQISATLLDKGSEGTHGVLFAAMITLQFSSKSNSL